MMARAALFALLVALSLPLGVVGAPTNAATADDPASLHSVAILTLGENTRANFATPSLDVATAMAAQRESAADRLDRYALEARLQAAGSTEARKTLLFEAATAVEIRITALRDAERRLRTAYADRELDTPTFVRRLALLHAQTNELRQTLDSIQRLADEIPQFSLRGRVRLLDAALFGFEGPVRARTLAALTGESTATRIYIQAAEEGVVLSTIQGSRFVRETHRADNRDTDTVSGIGLSEAAERASVLYPIAYNTSTSIRTGINGLSGGLFRIDIEIRQGFITAYLDGATGQVFFEIQERRLDLLGPRPAAMNTENGTRLIVNRSYPGGPMEVAVLDNETRNPVPTTIVVDGTPIETGPDGTVWTLAPAAVSFNVKAIGAEGNVTVSVRTLAPTPVGSEG